MIDDGYFMVGKNKQKTNQTSIFNFMIYFLQTLRHMLIDIIGWQRHQNIMDSH